MCLQDCTNTNLYRFLTHQLTRGIALVHVDGFLPTGLKLCRSFYTFEYWEREGTWKFGCPCKKTQTSVSPGKKKTTFNPSPLSNPTLTVPNKYIQQNQPTCSKTMEKDHFHWLNLSILLFWTVRSMSSNLKRN